MGFAPRRITLSAALAAAVAIPAESHAARLDADGLGQALIFPYYTAQSADGNPLNTYLSVVNHTPDAKAVRVRFREGRMGAETLSFNLFLSPNDVWTGAVVPSGSGTQLITADVSCTDPAFATPSAAGSLPFMDFRNTAFSGANDDGAGTGLDRTREGYVEMIEMATLTGTSAAAVTHTFAGSPANCAVVQGAPSVFAAVPTGGLSGGLTLINVANGMDFTLNATPLAELSTRPFYRPATDPYPDFNASEIDPVSVVVANGSLYRSAWSRPVDAVSAVLMRASLMGEFVLDDVTNSNTEFVVTFPTRRFYATSASASPPFTQPAAWRSDCLAGEPFVELYSNREEGTAVYAPFYDLQPPEARVFCASAGVANVSNGSAHIPHRLPTPVLGSSTRGTGIGSGGFLVNASFSNGWIHVLFPQTPGPAMTSAAASERIDLATGARTSGAHRYRGLPVLGFTVRTFVNGTLACGAGACQGNYGGAFPLRYERDISALP